MAELDFPRLGFVYGGDPEIRAPAQLNISPELGIRVDVPIAEGDAEDEPYGGWFTDDASCPKELTFRDHLLDINLHGISAPAYTGAFGRGPGIGYLRPSFAVEDTDQSGVSYVLIDEMRSGIELLHDFMGWKLSTTSTTTRDGLLTEVELKTLLPDGVPVAQIDGIEVCVDPHWWAGQRDSRRSEIVESSWLRTYSLTPRSLAAHAEVHRRIRDFLAFVCWQPVEIEESQVQRVDAPAVALDAHPIGPSWRTLHTSSARQRRPGGPRKFTFADTIAPATIDAIGPDGIGAWLRMDAALRRASDPLLTLLYLESSTPEIVLMQTGIAAEALGYRLAIARGATQREAGSESFADRLAAILERSPLPIHEVIGDSQAWAQVTSAAYNGVKHANRELPDKPTCYMLAQTLCILIRAQVLLELGVHEDDVAEYRRHRQWWSLRTAYESLTTGIAARTPG